MIADKIESALNDERDWLLIGGPPCQAYSVMGRSRNKNKEGYEPLKDEKHFLYKEYLRIIANFWPAVFVMENVKGLLSSKPDPEDDPIFARILADLTAPADAESSSTTPSERQHRYKLFSLSPRRTEGQPAGRDFVLRAEEHGVPQARHRVIIVGVRDDFTDVAPAPLIACPSVPISSVLKQMPKLRSGVTEVKDSDDAWLKAFSTIEERRWFKSIETHSPEGIFQVALDSSRNLSLPPAGRGGEYVACVPRVAHRPDWFLDSRLKGVCNHSSRAHITKAALQIFLCGVLHCSSGVLPKAGGFPHRPIASSQERRRGYRQPEYVPRPLSRPTMD